MLHIHTYYSQLQPYLLYCLGVVLLVSGFTLYPQPSSAFTIYSDETVALRWSSNNVQDNCNGSGDVSSWNGRKTVADLQVFPPNTFAPGTTHTVTFSCNSSVASIWLGALLSMSDTLTVLPTRTNVDLQFSRSPSNPLTPTPTLSFSSTASFVPYRGNYALSWNYSDPYGSCLTSWTTSQQAIIGSNTLTNTEFNFDTNRAVDVQRTYTVRCSSPGLTEMVRSVTVTLRSGFEPPCGGPRQQLCR